MADDLNSLPVDETAVSHNEEQLINNLFGEKNKSRFGKIIDQFKDIFLAGALFIAFSLPLVDPYIVSYFPSCQSPYMLIMMKCILFMVSLFILKNFYLCKK